MCPISPGTIATASELGKRETSKFIWTVCDDCAQGRWVKVQDTRKPCFTGLCKPCLMQRKNGKMENSPHWKGGVKKVRGYVFIYLRPGDPYYDMADLNGYVKRSRLVMATHLGRGLTTEEDVHHEDENRENDDLDNLRLFPSKSLHITYHRIKEIELFGPRPVNGLGQYVGGGYHANKRTH